MKKLLFISLVTTLFTFSCTKDNILNNESEAKIDVRTLFNSGDDGYIDFVFSSVYGISYLGDTAIAHFSNEARFADNSIDGEVYFNDVPVALYDYGQYFLNHNSVNENSTLGYEIISKNAVGQMGNFKVRGFNKIGNFDIDIYTPVYINPVVQSNSDGVEIQWNVDENIDNDIFGVFLNYADSTDPSNDFLKHYIFNQSTGNAFIGNEDLRSIPTGARVNLTFARGVNAIKNIENKTVKALSYTVSSGHFIKK